MLLRHLLSLTLTMLLVQSCAAQRSRISLEYDGGNPGRLCWKDSAGDELCFSIPTGAVGDATWTLPAADAAGGGCVLSDGNRVLTVGSCAGAGGLSYGDDGLVLPAQPIDPDNEGGQLVLGGANNYSDPWFFDASQGRARIFAITSNFADLALNNFGAGSSRFCVNCTAPAYTLDVAGDVRLPNQSRLWMNDSSGVPRQALYAGDGNLHVGHTATAPLGGSVILEATGGSSGPVQIELTQSSSNAGWFSPLAGDNVSLGLSSAGFKELYFAHLGRVWINDSSGAPRQALYGFGGDLYVGTTQQASVGGDIIFEAAGSAGSPIQARFDWTGSDSGRIVPGGGDFISLGQNGVGFSELFLGSDALNWSGRVQMQDADGTVVSLSAGGGHQLSVAALGGLLPNNDGLFLGVDAAQNFGFNRRWRLYASQADVGGDLTLGGDLDLGFSSEIAGSPTPSISGAYSVGAAGARYANIYTNRTHYGASCVFSGQAIFYSGISGSLELRTNPDNLTGGAVLEITSPFFPASSGVHDLGLSVREWDDVYAERFRVSDRYYGPSGAPGLNLLLSCPSGQAIKTLNISGGIITDVTCAAP